MESFLYVGWRKIIWISILAMSYKLPARKSSNPKRTKLFPETIVQTAVVEWFYLTFPQYPKSLIRIENEGKRNAAQAALAYRMGLQKGASDLFIAIPTRRYAGLFIEVKKDKYKVTASNREHHDSQEQFIHAMNSLGYFATFGIGFDNCRYIIENYLSER